MSGITNSSRDERFANVEEDYRRVKENLEKMARGEGEVKNSASVVHDFESQISRESRA